MMNATDLPETNEACALIDDFLMRTGIRDGDGPAPRRYLWTDAFAVRTCFGLARATGDRSYHQAALRLIDEVHRVLGRHRDDDTREGWISGLSEEEGSRHPTANGLRIGKPLPEGQPGELYDDHLEWERDGQYFHYLVQWLPALLLAARETGDERYSGWAVELAMASGNFLAKKNGQIEMFWKMSIDLSRPLVAAMGAHDPLSGLIAVESLNDRLPEKATALEPLRSDFARLCRGSDWATPDPLGIGGLLLNLLTVAKLEQAGRRLPDDIRAEKLLEDALRSLHAISRSFDVSAPADQRLAFRECGLSLGLRAVDGCLHSGGLSGKLELVSAHAPLADEIEAFWSDRKNRKGGTWEDHLDINAVSLAASLTAKAAPDVFA